MQEAAPAKLPRDAAPVPARLDYHEKESTSATAWTVSYTEPQRVVRAVLGGLACWGIAVLCVFIPLGHFILVPAFLLAGPAVFFMRLLEGVSLKGAHGVCPACGAEQTFTESGRLLAPHPVRCSSCSRQLELHVPGAAGLGPAGAGAMQDAGTQAS